MVVGGQQGSLYHENFNPFASAALIGTQGLIYQPLFYFSLNNSKVTPLLGTSFGWSNHDRTLTVHLRHGVHWSDGQLFTARDVVYSFAIRKRYPQLDTLGVWQYLSAVKAVGPYTVQFQFKQVDVPFQWYILGQTSIIQRIYVDANPKTNHYWFPSGSTLMLYTNFKDPLLARLPVRQAMSYAINRL